MILKDRFDILTASDIDEAVQSLENTRPDVIFLDIRMPKGNGLDFLKHVKSINPAIPVVIVTAFPSSQTAITAFRNGAFDYITKPFNVAVARQRIRNLLERERLRKELEYQRDLLQHQIAETELAKAQDIAAAMTSSATP